MDRRNIRSNTGHDGRLRTRKESNPFTGPVEPSGICSDLLSGVRTALLSAEVHDYARFALDYLEDEILSKYTDGSKNAAADRKRLAIEKFLACEEQCRITNLRLQSSFNAIFSGGLTASSVLYTASRKIAELLYVGCDHHSACGCLEQICDPYFQFGPGTTSVHPSSKRDLADKYNGAMSCTNSNLGLALRAVARRPLWQRALIEGGQRLSFHESDKITTVPKNSKIDRVICIQPSMNIFIQKGIGAFIRSRLRKVGVDLNDQGVNAGMALSQSRFQSLGTLDLSAASDTISREIVSQLLPEHVLTLLEQSRVSRGVLPCGTTLTYHKFSAMGNGYTFELESLIFWALCSAVIDLLRLDDRRCFVYGDDILIPVGALTVVQEVLEHCGFTPNTKKTHFTGSFRESCGTHGYDGYDVTPFYVRKPFDLSSYFTFHNNFVAWIGRLRSLIPRHTAMKLYALAVNLRLRVKENLRFLVPIGYGDIGFISFFDESAPPRSGNQAETYRIRCYEPGGRTLESNDIGPLLKFLSLADSSHGFDREIRGDRKLVTRGRARKRHVWWTDPVI